MDKIDRFGIAKLLDPSNVQFSGQQRVNAEIFTAMEILGRKLERSESERDRLARRLALIESAATVDERTGKLYLPIVMDKPAPARNAGQQGSRGLIAASLMSSSIALFALGLVLFREPMMPLTQDQIAALDTLRTPARFALTTSENSAWKPADTVAQLPDAAELSQQEQTAEKPKLAAVQATDVTPAETVKTVIETAQPETKSAPVTQVAEKKPAPEKVTKRETLTSAEVKAKPEESSSLEEVTQEFLPDTSLLEKLSQLENRAARGIPEAQHDMATIYASGKLVAQNYPRSIYWFTKAAYGGVANAHYNLGVIYQQGLGVKPDMKKALSWYEKAAELGHPEAMYNLGIAYAEGIGITANIQKAVSYFKRAANAGVGQAAFNLGILYESNLLGPPDAHEALEWHQIATNNGHTDARAAVRRLNGTADQTLTLANIDTIEPASGDSGKDDADRITTTEFKNGLLAKVQRELVREGLLSGKADGIMTPQTEDAIRAHQKKLGLREDGQPSQELLDKMVSLSSSSH